MVFFVFNFCRPHSGVKFQFYGKIKESRNDLITFSDNLITFSVCFEGECIVFSSETFFRPYSVLMRQDIFIVRGVNDNSRVEV